MVVSGGGARGEAVLVRVFTLFLFAFLVAFTGPYPAYSQSEIMSDIDRTVMSSRPHLKKHPWYSGNPRSESDWNEDQDKILGSDFWDCFEARKVESTCDYCKPKFGWFLDDDCYIPFYNPGMVIEYWWPEYEIETNNFGISSINPVSQGKRDYARDKLIQGIQREHKREAKKYLKKYGVQPWGPRPDGFPKGNSHFAGMLPGDQTLVQEGHTYLTKVQDDASKLRQKGYGHCGDIYIYIPYYDICIDIGDFWYNGYLYGNSFSCFYDALDKEADTPIKAWTEDHRFAKYWRIPLNTRELNSDLYDASAPFTLSDNVRRNIRKIKTSDFYTKNSCGSYRAAAWPSRYGDLKDMVDITPDDSHPNDVICYKGGGQLYPTTGTLMGHYSPLPSAAYLARRAAEAVGMISNDILGRGSGGFGGGSSGSGGGSGGFGGGGSGYWDNLAPEQVNKFTRITYGSGGWSKDFKEVDKLQRIYPDQTRCFRASEIDEDDETLFPKDLIRPSHLGSVRHVVWNKRQACVCEMRGSVGTVELEEDDSCDTLGLTDKKGFGCQLYEREEDKLDDARGNVEEDTIDGDENSAAELPARCLFPFNSIAMNGCSILDLIMGNYGPMMSGGGGGSGGSGGF